MIGFGDIMAGIGSGADAYAGQQRQQQLLKAKQPTQQEKAMEIIKVLLGGAAKGKNNNDFGGVLAGMNMTDLLNDPVRFLESLKFGNRSSGTPMATPSTRPGAGQPSSTPRVRIAR